MKWDEFMDCIGRRLALLTKVVKLTVTVAGCLVAIGMPRLSAWLVCEIFVDMSLPIDPSRHPE